jgi:CRISPR-associated protein Cas2
MDNEALDTLTARLRGIISEEDSIRIYTLCGKCEKSTVVLGTGKVTKDEDVYIL